MAREWDAELCVCSHLYVGRPEVVGRAAWASICGHDLRAQSLGGACMCILAMVLYTHRTIVSLAC